MLIVTFLLSPLGDAQRGTQGEGKGVSWWRDKEGEGGLRVCEGVKEVKG